MCPDESFGVPLKSLGEEDLALGDNVIGAAVMQDFRCQEADAGVMVLGVVPGEEDLAEAAGVLEGAEAIGELGRVLQGFELAFRERVVMGDVGAAGEFWSRPGRPRPAWRSWKCRGRQGW